MFTSGMLSRFLLFILFLSFVSESCTKSGTLKKPTAFFVQETVASWYGEKFHERKTANGEKYDMHAYTAAHRYLNFGTIVRVTNELNGNETIVRINDRGPYAKNRGIDLSKQAAIDLGMIDTGVASVRVEIIDYPAAGIGKICMHVRNFNNLRRAREISAKKN